MPLPNRSFRLVCAPQEIPAVEELLRVQGFEFEPEPFLCFARKLVAEPFPLGRSLAAFFGLIYIQDRSSMLPSLALAPTPGSVVLDMCASPGSKTGLNAQFAGPAGTVLGNEPGLPRLATLRRNLQSLNLIGTCTCCHPGEALPLPSASEGGGFDFIQLDPPCSGWGTVEKNPNVMKLWQGDKVKPLVTLQQKLLRKAADLLRPGGRLVFSTCTTNVDEDEQQVLFALELGLQPVTLPPPEGVLLADPRLGLNGVWRIDTTDSGQGFFVAAFTKPGCPSLVMHQPEAATAPFTEVGPEALSAAGIIPETLPPGKAGVFGDTLMFLPQKALERFPASLHWQGFALGKCSGGRLIPSPRLRLKSGKRSLDIDEAERLTGLLSGQSLQTGLSGNFADLTWRGLPLGRIRLKNGRAMWSER